MKRFLKIFLAVVALLLIALVGIWFVIKPKPQWDEFTGHLVEDRTEETESYTVARNVLWASPQGFNLTMDIFSPTAEGESFPVVIIFHGGGWLINDKGIMEEASTYFASTGRYVVCNVNYRLLGDLGNAVRMNEIIEDAAGSILWIKAHIASYKGDPKRVILTGDSAGGHLAAVPILQGSQLSSEGFSSAPVGFRPTWLPAGKTAEDIARERGLAVQAAMLSYGAFDLFAACGGNSEAGSAFESRKNILWALASRRPRGIFGEAINVRDQPEYYLKVSPAHQVADTSELSLPPILLTAGELDPVVTPESVQAFREKLTLAGHGPVEYWEYKGQTHAFLDSGDGFAEKAIPALEVMVAFLDRIFYAG